MENLIKTTFDKLEMDSEAQSKIIFCMHESGITLGCVTPPAPPHSSPCFL